jgi:hypothetical protein
MPQASGAGGAGAKYAYLDHDSAYLNQVPPVLNQWYTVFNAQDVRLLGCFIEQENDEAQNETIEVRWTCDGTVYFCSVSTNSGTEYEASRTKYSSTGGGDGIDMVAVAGMPFVTRDKRAQDFLVEVRIISALGTNQTLRAWCVYETLETT